MPSLRQGSTTIRPDLPTNHDHGATMIKLAYHVKDDGSDGCHRSRPLVLVSNKDDDTHTGAVNIPTDRSVDDPTHITALGGKVKVVRLTTGAGWFAAHCEATVKKRRQVWVKQWVLSDAGLTDESKNITSQVGPSKFSADLQGWTLGGGLSFSL